MSQKLTKSCFALAILGASLASGTTAQAGWPRCNTYYYPATPAPVPAPARPALTGYEMVPHPTYKPQSTTRRTQVTSGSQITLFGCFLGSQEGQALLNVGGTSTECNISNWTNNSVTLDLPRFGLSSPKDADIELLTPEGRIIKVFRLCIVSPADVVEQGVATHLPMPPAPISRPTTYVTPVQGGLVLHASFQ